MIINRLNENLQQIIIDQFRRIVQLLTHKFHW